MPQRDRGHVAGYALCTLSQVLAELPGVLLESPSGGGSARAPGSGVLGDMAEESIMIFQPYPNDTETLSSGSAYANEPF